LRHNPSEIGVLQLYSQFREVFALRKNMPESPFESFDRAPEVAQNGPAEASNSRRDFLMLGALVGAALVLPQLPAQAAFGYSDTKYLRYLEELQYLQTDFFTKAALSATVDGLSEKEMSVFNLLAKQDAEQSRWFRNARQRFGANAFNKPFSPNMSVSRVTPAYKFPNKTFLTREELYARAIELKEISVSAFHGVVGRANDAEIIQSVAALAGVQNRHLAILKENAGQNPLDSYVAAISPQAAASRLSKYKFAPEALS
jgi:hypothetical protein